MRYGSSYPQNKRVSRDALPNVNTLDCETYFIRDHSNMFRPSVNAVCERSTGQCILIDIVQVK